MSVDTIGDFLTMIRNGVRVSNPSIVVPYSKMRYEIAQILKDEGFIRDLQLIAHESPAQRKMKVVFKYVDGESVIHEITRVSKLGRRMYTGSQNIDPVIGGLGLSILTTSKGVISHIKAKELGVGGEILCTIW